MNGYWHVNYTVSAQYPEELKYNTLFRYHLINDNGAQAIQEGFYNWIKKDIENKYTYNVTQGNNIIIMKCEEFELSVFQNPSRILNSFFLFGDYVQAFIGKFNSLCNFAKGRSQVHNEAFILNSSNNHDAILPLLVLFSSIVLLKFSKNMLIIKLKNTLKLTLFSLCK